MFKFVKHLFLVAYIVILPFKLTGMYPEPSSSNFGIKKIGGIACIGGAAAIAFCAAKPEMATNYINQASNLIPYSWVTNATQKSVQFLSEHPFISAGSACLLGSFGLYAITKQEKKSPLPRTHFLRKTPEEKERDKNRNIAWEYLKKEFPYAEPKNICDTPNPVAKKEETVEEKPKQPWEKVNEEEQEIKRRINELIEHQKSERESKAIKKKAEILWIKKKISILEDEIKNLESQLQQMPIDSQATIVEDQVEKKQPPVLKQKNVTPRALEISLEGKSFLMPIISEKNSISQFIFEKCMRPQLLQLATIPSEKAWEGSILHFIIKKTLKQIKKNKEKQTQILRDHLQNKASLSGLSLSWCINQKINKPMMLCYNNQNEKKNLAQQLNNIGKEVIRVTQSNLENFSTTIPDIASKKTIIFDCTKSKGLDINNMIYKWVETWQSLAKRDASKDLILEKSIIVIASEEKREFIELVRSQQLAVLQARQWAEGLSKEDESSKKPKPQRICFAFCENQKRVDLIKKFLMLENLPNIAWIDSTTQNQTEEYDSNDDEDKKTNQLSVINSYECDMHKIFRWILEMRKQAITEENQDPRSRTLLIIPLEFQKNISVLSNPSSKAILSLSFLIKRVESPAQDTEIMHPIDDQNEKNSLKEALKIYAELGKKTFSEAGDTITIDQKIINLSEENLTAENLFQMMTQQRERNRQSTTEKKSAY